MRCVHEANAKDLAIVEVHSPKRPRVSKLKAQEYERNRKNRQRSRPIFCSQWVPGPPSMLFRLDGQKVMQLEAEVAEWKAGCQLWVAVSACLSGE